MVCGGTNEQEMIIKIEWIEDTQDIYQWWTHLTKKERDEFRRTLRKEIWEKLDSVSNHWTRREL